VAVALEQNKKFFQEEAVAFIIANYPSYTFDNELTREFIARYIDALQ
jgi:hypothetical protein